MLGQERISAIALCVSIFGVALLLLFSEVIEARQVKIQEIDNSMLDWHVVLNARVESVWQKNDTIFMQLYDGTGKIKAVLFKPSREQQALIGKNMFASFEGKVQFYRNELEIVVERVEKWA